MRKVAQMALPLFFLATSFSAQATELRFVGMPDIKLAYVEAGQGKPVILVHGGLQDYRFWSTQVDALAKSYRVIAYSRRNHFPNEIGLEGAPDNAADLHADDLAALVRALNLQPVHVVAHSSGAHTALFFASKYPDMVGSLSVHEPPAVGLIAGKPEGAATLKDLGARLAPAREAFRKGDLGSGVRLFTDGLGGVGSYDGRPEAERKMMADNAVSHAADATSARPRAPFTCEMAKRISASTLLTSSERSLAFFHRIAEELERCLPKVERHTFLNAAHTVQSEHPEEYAKVVLKFLAAQAP